MAMNIKKLFASPESSCSLMLIAGVLSLLGSLTVAVVIWKRWGDIGVLLGPRAWAGVVIVSLVTIVLAAASGIWALRQINSLTGPTAVKCTIACLIDAVALAILMAFLITAFYLNVSV